MKIFDKIRRNLKNSADVAGKRAKFFVDQHARKGQFRGGDLAQKGYSTKWIPAFFLGTLTSNQNGSINVKHYFTSGVLPKQDIEWRTGLKKTAYYTKGYKGWRELTGRNTSKVDLTFSGEMLRNLTYQTKVSGGILTVQVFVKAPYNDRMSFTNARREWVYLSQQEIKTISDELARSLLN